MDAELKFPVLSSANEMLVPLGYCDKLHILNQSLTRFGSLLSTFTRIGPTANVSVRKLVGGNKSQ